ncbi:hypothetical protein ABH924_004741 [Arthrobacter sp. GAS37]|uniref:HNH endonuclease n=1 Tax=Arthrobacter sp. GAS37 TaxID=3156261 RepID=UPI00383277E5
MGRKDRSVEIRIETASRAEIPILKTRRTAVVDLYYFDKGICWLCQGPVDLEIRDLDPRSPEIDHVIPVSAGGQDVWGNVRLSHRACNILKSDRAADQCSPAEYRRNLERMVFRRNHPDLWLHMLISRRETELKEISRELRWARREQKRLEDAGRRADKSKFRSLQDQIDDLSLRSGQASAYIGMHRQDLDSRKPMLQLCQLGHIDRHTN